MQPLPSRQSYLETIRYGISCVRQGFTDLRIHLAFAVEPDPVLEINELPFATIDFLEAGSRILLTFFHVLEEPATEMIDALAQLQAQRAVMRIDVCLVHCTEPGRSLLFSRLVALHFLFREDGQWLGWRARPTRSKWADSSVTAGVAGTTTGFTRRTRREEEKNYAVKIK